MSPKLLDCSKVYTSYVVGSPAIAAAAAAEVRERIKKAIPVPVVDEFVASAAAGVAVVAVVLSSPFVLAPAATVHQAKWLDGCQGGDEMLKRAADVTQWPGIYEEIRGP